jgi:hypothetical protein
MRAAAAAIADEAHENANMTEKTRGVSRPNGVLQYGMEEAAEHPVPDGKFVKVQCVHKSVPRIIE